MNIIFGIASYLTAFVVLALIPNLTQVLWVPLFRLLRRRKALRPPTAFFLAASGVVIGILCFTAIADHTRLRVALAMILLPAFLSFSNRRERVRRALAGVSRVKQMLREAEEESAYDQKSDVETEYGYLYGDILGYVVGILFFVQPSPFF